MKKSSLIVFTILHGRKERLPLFSCLWSPRLGSMADREEVTARQKAERKQMIAECQKLKHGIPKGDKKKKKEVTEQIARIEAELDAKHEQELKDLDSSPHHDVQEATEGVSQLSVGACGGEGQEEPDDGEEDGTQQQQQSKKPSRAQKRREKKTSKNQEREARIQVAAIVNLQGPRHQENLKLKALLQQRGLKVFQIPSDGDCMYSAVRHQLAFRGISETSASLRQKTAKMMQSHQDDYLPFLTHPETGDSYSPEDFEGYCKEVETTTAWGGHLELRALSEALGVPMEVVQAEGNKVTVGDQFQGSPVVLVYHRHALGLGEHYNSVVERGENEEEEEPEDSGR